MNRGGGTVHVVGGEWLQKNVQFEVFTVVVVESPLLGYNAV
jgi:hypothetical protein